MSAISIDWNPNQKSLRQFGFICAGAMTLLGLWCRWRGGLFLFHFSESVVRNVSIGLWIVAAISFVLAIVAPKLIKPLYLGLTLATFPIGFVVSHVLMGILYYGVFTPIGLLFRIIGRDSMHRKLEPQRASYWIERTPNKSIDRYFRQF